MNITLQREEMTDTYTIGTMVANEFTCKTLELPWKDNLSGKSCVPEGTYTLIYEWSNAFGKHLWELKDVPGRSECKIHNGNFTRQIRGCILVGREHADIDGDGIVDVATSKPTLKELHDILEEYQTEAITITIVDKKEVGIYADNRNNSHTIGRGE